jgi:hypothetical protein
MVEINDLKSLQCRFESDLGYAPLAQRIERMVSTHQVGSSNLSRGAQILDKHQES